MNRDIVIHISGFLLVLGLVFIALYQGFKPYGGKSYQINMTGSFLLVNQEDLLKRINDLSASVKNRQLFLNQIEKLLVSEPYIGSSNVRYNWPDEIVIDIQEIVPKALIRGHGFLASNCMVINYQGMNFENVYLFELKDIGLNKSTCQKIIKIQPYLTNEIKLVTLLSNGDYRLVIDDVQYVISDDFDKMFARVWRTHHGLWRRGLSDPLIVDLRYSSGGAVSLL